MASDEIIMNNSTI